MRAATVPLIQNNPSGGESFSAEKVRKAWFWNLTFIFNIFMSISTVPFLACPAGMQASGGAGKRKDKEAIYGNSGCRLVRSGSAGLHGAYHVSAYDPQGRRVRLRVFGVRGKSARREDFFPVPRGDVRLHRRTSSLKRRDVGISHVHRVEDTCSAMQQQQRHVGRACFRGGRPLPLSSGHGEFRIGRQPTPPGSGNIATTWGVS